MSLVSLPETFMSLQTQHQRSPVPKRDSAVKGTSQTRYRRRSGLRSVIGVVTVSVLCVASVGPAQGDVILEVSDNGADLTLGWTGTMDVGGITSSADSGDIDLYSEFNDLILSSDGSSRFSASAGNWAGVISSPWISSTAINNPSSAIGTGFGYSGSALYWDDSFGTSPGIIAPTASWTFTGLTVATAFGTNLDSGPVIVWTHGTTNETISVGLASAAAVPEPSTTGLLGLCGLGFAACRRRRKNRQRESATQA